MARRLVLSEDRSTTVVDSGSPASLDADGVRVRVSLAGINFWEIMQRYGRVPLLADGTPGLEGVGVVEATGSAVEDVSVGQRVAWSKVPGSYAEFVDAPSAALVPVPDGVSDEAAASVLFQGLTADYLCREAWPLESGRSAVVTAASGGVGHLLTQMLVSRGVTVLGLVSNLNKAQPARSSGASEVLEYGDSVAEKVLDKSANGVDAVFDAVGGPLAESLVGALAARGAIVLYGSASGVEANISAADLSRASLYLTRAAGRDYLGDSAEIWSRSTRLLNEVANGRLQPAVGATFDLDHVDDAWNALESRTTVGKLLVRP